MVGFGDWLVFCGWGLVVVLVLVLFGLVLWCDWLEGEYVEVVLFVCSPFVYWFCFWDERVGV